MMSWAPVQILLVAFLVSHTFSWMCSAGCSSSLQSTSFPARVSSWIIGETSVGTSVPIAQLVLTCRFTQVLISFSSVLSLSLHMLSVLLLTAPWFFWTDVSFNFPIPRLGSHNSRSFTFAGQTYGWYLLHTFGFPCFWVAARFLRIWWTSVCCVHLTWRASFFTNVSQRECSCQDCCRKRGLRIFTPGSGWGLWCWGCFVRSFANAFVGRVDGFGRWIGVFLKWVFIPSQGWAHFSTVKHPSWIVYFQPWVIFPLPKV